MEWREFYAWLGKGHTAAKDGGTSFAAQLGDLLPLGTLGIFFLFAFLFCYSPPCPCLFLAWFRYLHIPVWFFSFHIDRERS